MSWLILMKEVRWNLLSRLTQRTINMFTTVPPKWVLYFVLTNSIKLHAISSVSHDE